MRCASVDRRFDTGLFSEALVICSLLKLRAIGWLGPCQGASVFGHECQYQASRARRGGLVLRRDSGASAMKPAPCVGMRVPKMLTQGVASPVVSHKAKCHLRAPRSIHTVRPLSVLLPFCAASRRSLSRSTARKGPGPSTTSVVMATVGAAAAAPSASSPGSPFWR